MASDKSLHEAFCRRSQDDCQRRSRDTPLPLPEQRAFGHSHEQSYNPTVYIVDGDINVHKTVGELLRSVGLMAKAYLSPTEFWQAAHTAPAGCIILDVRFVTPEPSGLAFQRELLASNPDYALVFLTEYGDVRMCVEAMKFGAIDFLIKPARDQELLDAVRLGLERSRRCDESTKSIASVMARYSSLTFRESEIFLSITIGLLNKQIAAHLGISEGTVKVHRGTMMRKMAVSTLVELVRLRDKLGTNVKH
jgi:FixJ family two-component response regulator